jgi:D-beta-D-heptose 7-phosphate kinase/D-beta-D-heptose 1-phosphate adenosyltransferase
MSYRRPKVLVLGDLMLDLWVRATPRASNPEGAAMIVSGVDDGRDVTLGGAGLVASLLRSLNARVKPMGRLGNDTAGATAHALLHEFGLSCKNVTFSEDLVTPAKMRFINSHGQVIFRYDQESSTEEYLQQAARDFDFARYSEHVARADAVVVADYGKGYCQLHGQKIIEAARYYGALVVVGAKPGVLDFYRGADVIKVNDEEARVYLEKHNLQWSPDRHETAQAFCAAVDARVAIVTGGRLGTTYAVRDEQKSCQTYHAPARACFPAVTNCVGAGDAFLAGLVAELLLPPQCHSAPDADRLHGAVAAASAAAAQYLTRGVPTIDPATPFLASYSRRVESGSATKIRSFEDAVVLCEAWRSVGESVVFTNGCFDLLHRGHVALLEQAKQQGKKLIVAVNSDDSVRLLKGSNRPAQTFDTRAQVLASLSCVDAVVMLDEENFAAQPALRAMITTFVPDVLVKGAQYKEEDIVGFEEMVNRDSPGRIWRCPMVDDVSTTHTVQRIQHG